MQENGLHNKKSKETKTTKFYECIQNKESQAKTIDFFFPKWTPIY